MKNKLFFKILTILILIITTVSIYSPSVQASAMANSLTGAGDFINDGVRDTSPTIDENSLQEMSNTLYNALLVVAVIVAVIVGLVIGIQFMTGSVAQKAKIKETLVPYIVGCVVIFGAFAIWKIVVNILGEVA